MANNNPFASFPVRIAPARALDHSMMEFDKSSVATANMAWMLSQARPWLKTPDDQALCDYVLKLATQSLTTEFRSDNGFVKTARIGDEQEDGRSARSSITPKRIREALSPQDREWARQNLGLFVESNPQPVKRPSADVVKCPIVSPIRTTHKAMTYHISHQTCPIRDSWERW